MECPVCLSNKKKRFISCFSCHEVNACVTCTKTYLLSNILSTKCMKCRIPWSLNDIKSFLGQSFHKEFMEKYKIELFEQEKKDIDTFGYLINDLKKLEEKEKRILELKKEYQKVQEDARKLTERVHTMPPPLNYTFRCPNDDGGWVDEEGEYCTVCGEDICPICIKIVPPTETHQCKKEDMEFIQNLRDTTRPCPNCKIRIDKLEGCDVMYCLYCHHPFKWDTGETIEGFFHNPEHSELLNKGIIKRTEEERDYLGFIMLDKLPPFPFNSQIITGFYSILNAMANQISENEVSTNGYIRIVKAKYLGNMISSDTFSENMFRLTQDKNDITSALRMIYEEKANIEEMFSLIMIDEDIIMDLCHEVFRKINRFKQSKNNKILQVLHGTII